MRRGLAIILAIAICFCLFGCAESTHVSVTPHPQPDQYRELGELYASSFPQIRDCLVRLILDAADKGIIFLSDMEDSIARSYMDVSIRNVMESEPVAAYAVEAVQYELGTNKGRKAIAVEIDFKKSESDILHIKNVENMDEAMESVAEVLEQVGSTVTLRVEDYRSTDFALLVQRYADARPDVVMEIPQVVAAVYPETGKSRVVEIAFSYRTDPQQLLHMKELVWPVFTAAELYVQGSRDAMDKYGQLYHFLMQRYDYIFTASATPTYSLLQEGTGDCRAFACVYGAMCKKAGLPGSVISGTRDGEPWYWNQIEDNGITYYVDLLQSYQQGSMELLTEEQMENYSWDTEYYGNNNK